MAFNISDFKANGLILGGARPALFEVAVFPPFGSPNAQRIRFLARSASIPPSSIDPVRVPYFGRPIKLAGDRDFPDWTVTIMNDEDFAIRKIMEKWSNQINALISNRQDEDVFPLAYKTTAEVTQFGKTGDIIARYEFQGLWPNNVDVIPLDWEQRNTIEQFDVTFSYDLWVPGDGAKQGPDDYVPTLADEGISS